MSAAPQRDERPRAEARPSSAAAGSGTTSAAAFSTSSGVHSSPIAETGLQRDGVPSGICTK